MAIILVDNFFFEQDLCKLFVFINICIH